MSDPVVDKVSQRKRDSLMGQLIVVAAVVLLVIVGVFAARTGINRKEVEHKLTSIEKELNKVMEERGYSIAFSYEDVDIGGGLFSKRITIKNPVFQIQSDKERGFYSGMTVSSDRITVVPSDSEFSEAKLSFPTPITVERGRGSWVITATDMAVLFERDTDDEVDLIDYSIALNKSIAIDNRETNKKTLLSFHEGSDIHGQLDVKNRLYSQESYFTGFLLSREGAYTLEGKDVKWTVTSARESDALIKRFKLNAESLSFQDEMAPLGTLKVTMEAEETVTPSTQPDGAPVRTINSTIVADAGDYTFTTDGALQYQGTNFVPFGEAKISITKPSVMLDALESAAVINRGVRALLGSGLEFASGRPITEATDKVQVTLRRSEGGSFIIGRTTFEELAAHVLRGLIDTSAEDVVVPEVETAPDAATEVEPVPAPTEAEQQINQIKKNMNDIGDVIESLEGDAVATPPAPIEQGE